MGRYILYSRRKHEIYLLNDHVQKNYHIKGVQYFSNFYFLFFIKNHN